MSVQPAQREDHDCLAGGGDMGALMRSLDWSQTPIGPVESWSPALQMMVRTLLVNRFPMLLWWGPEYIQLYNDAYRPIPGTKHPRSMTQSAQECWPEIWHKIGPLIDTPFHGGPATWMDDILLEVHRHGFVEETHFTIAYSPVPDETAPGGIGGVLATVNEITGQVVGERRMVVLRDLGTRPADTRNAEDACIVAARTLAAHPKDVPFALLYLTDADGRHARLAGVAGVPAGEAISPPIIALNPADHSAWPLADVRRTEETRLVTGLGKRFPWVPAGPWADPPDTAVILPVRSNKAHDVTGFLVAGISARLPLDDSYRGFLDLAAAQIATAIANARAYEEEKRRAEALTELDRAKTAFFSNVSHEFRTPLTLMLGPVEDLLAGGNGDLSAPQRERLEVAHRNAMRLQKLVNTLLDFSRIEAGRAQASYEPVDLSALTTDLASNFRSACAKAGLELRVDCPPLSELAYVDRDMWEKIVLNLLSNAFKYTMVGEIEVSLREAKSQVILAVRDTGDGIPREQMVHLFERFHRVEGARGRTHEGTGIGLALVRELARLHGGDVRAESEPGKGSTFTVTIPRGKSHLPADRIGVAATLASTALRAAPYLEEALHWLPDGDTAQVGEMGDSWTRRSATYQRAEPNREPRILVADDNADMRQYVVRLLADRYRVVAVPDGEAALMAVRQQTPDLVISDIMMPRLDGFALLRELRADPGTSGIPVVLLSARAGEESRVEGMEAGADDYLIKPFSARELLARVSSHLQIARLRREGNESLRKSEERFRLLWEAAALLLSANDPDTMLRELFAKIGPHLGLDAYFNYAVDEGQDTLRLASYGGISDSESRVIARLEFGQAISGTVALNRQPLHVTHIQQSAEPMVQLVRSLGIRTCACNPLITGGRLLGTLSFASRSRNQFDADELTFLQTLCYYVTVAYERLRLLTELKEGDRRKDEFLATLAHELRNPLAPIRNAAQLFRFKGSDEPELRWGGDVIDRQVAHLSRLIDDLLDVSRITRNKLELRKERVELADVVKGAVETSRPLIEQCGHELMVRLPAEPIYLHADLVRLAQVFMNLLTNAAKYTERGGRVLLTADRHGGGVAVRVRDNGVGIPAEKLPRLFDLFFQVDPSMERSQGGLGIGLSLVRRLVELHGGTVKAYSAGRGKGSEFTVRLPVLADAPTLAPPHADGNGESTATPSRRILVADDMTDCAESLALLPRMTGNAVETAHDGLAAVEIAERFRPEVVLLDIGMPKLNGYDACRRIREQPWGRNMVLVALTGWGTEEDRRRTEEAGFDAHLVKPVDPDTLTTLLSGLNARG